MSNEEKLKRDRHQKIRRIWSIVLFVEIIVCALTLVSLIYVNHKSSELIDVNYTETPSVEFEFSVIDNPSFEKVTPDKALEADILDDINAVFKYDLNVASNNFKHSYEYKIEKYIEFSDRQNGSTDPYLYEEIKSFTGTAEGGRVSINENVVVSYKTALEEAKKELERLDDSSISAHLFIKMNVSVVSSCDNFTTKGNESASFVLKIQLPNASKLTHMENYSDAANSSQFTSCSRAGDVAAATKTAILPTGIILVVSILGLFLFLSLTRNKDVDYANRIRSILRGYKSYIQVSSSEFTSSGFLKVYKIGTITEMLEIRDTLQKPVIMIENGDRTCSHFFIIDNDVMYLHGICVEGFEHLLYPEEETTPVTVVEYVTPAPVVEEVQEEVVEEHDDEEIDEETAKLLSMCSYTFEAKLILAEQQMKDFYTEIANFALSYGVKVVRSAKRERIYLGRKLFANLTFSGKKLCVAMPLNPADYQDSKYKFKDMSEVKKFAGTPFVMKVTSGLKVRHIKELLTMMFEAEGLQNKNLDVKVKKIPTKSKKTLIKEGLIKVNTRKINN